MNDFELDFEFAVFERCGVSSSGRPAIKVLCAFVTKVNADMYANKLRTYLGPQHSIDVATRKHYLTFVWT